MVEYQVSGAPLRFPLDRMIFGGSFDPPHLGHLAMARYVLDEGLTRTLDFIPAALSPFKVNEEPPAQPQRRLDMLRLGVEEELKQRPVRILEIELLRPPPSYTVDTCRSLREEFPGERIGLLLGSDSFPHFHRWFAPDEILKHHPLVVFMRPGDDRQAILEKGRELLELFPGDQGEGPSLAILDNPRVDCSSTEIKARISGGELAGGKDSIPADLARCLPGPVLDYIVQNRIYA